MPAAGNTTGAAGGKAMNMNMMRQNYYPTYNNGYNLSGGSGNASSSPNRMGGNPSGYMNSGNFQGANMDQQYGAGLEDYGKQVDFYGAGGDQGVNMEGSQWK
mmetsp:Transcript_24349/g.27629  ORF Transcript_24349/g.27629 Transcript_24349/m.27629 type:complete len:102 (-) Transcript_24349:474-779(-)